MNYTLHQLQVFLKVAETNSVTKASEQLHLSQPAVSIQLRNFQDQFDVPLTEVVGRRLYVTEFGKEISIMAKRILEEVEAINYKATAYKGLLSGKLKVSSVSTGKYMVPYILTPFLKKNSAIEFDFKVTNRTVVLEQLTNNEIDFAFMSVIPDNVDVNYLEVMPNYLHVVHKDAATCESSLAILSDETWIFREEGSGTRLTMEGFTDSHGIKFKKSITLATNEAVKQAVMSGLGYSVLPLIGIQNELYLKQLHIISVEEFPIKTTWCIVWLKNKRLSPVAEAFIEYFERERSEIYADRFRWIENYI
ncbi:MAG: hypothetical protein RL226_220 [Bacteroidota bacterium]